MISQYYLTKFIKDTFITYISRVLTFFLGITASVIIARVLGHRGQGIYSMAILLPSLLVVFASFGISPASVFFTGKKKYAFKEIFGNNIIFSFLISIFAILIGFIIIFFFNNSFFPGVARNYLFLGLSLIPLQFFIDFIINILWGLQKIKETNFINIFHPFIFLVLVGVFLLGLGLGIKAAIIAQGIAYFSGGIVLFFLAVKIVGRPSFHFNKFYFVDSFLYGLKMYFSDIFGFIHQRVDIFMLNIFLNPTAVGFYVVAVAIAEKIWFVSQPVAAVLFPRVASETDKERLKNFTPLVYRNVLLILIVTIILLFLLGRWFIVFLYSEEFLNSVSPFRILLIGTITAGVGKILVNDLSGRGKPMLVNYINIGGAILNIILNILWIPKFQLVGAAWATAISYTVGSVILLIVYSRVSGNKIKDVIFIKKSDLQYYGNFLKYFILKYPKKC